MPIATLTAYAPLAYVLIGAIVAGAMVAIAFYAYRIYLCSAAYVALCYAECEACEAAHAGDDEGYDDEYHESWKHRN